MTTQHKQIKSNDDFKAVAVDIVNNLESWRVDSQKKTELALSKIVANMNKKDEERRIAVELGVARDLDNSHYGYGNKRIQGD